VYTFSTDTVFFPIFSIHTNRTYKYRTHMYRELTALGLPTIAN
jgi:hypothetical protein